MKCSVWSVREPLQDTPFGHLGVSLPINKHYNSCIQLFSTHCVTGLPPANSTRHKNVGANGHREISRKEGMTLLMGGALRG